MELLVSKFGTKSLYWIKYVEFIKFFNLQEGTEQDIQQIRGIYKRSLEYSKDQLPYLASEFQTFESNFGLPIFVERASTYLNNKNIDKMQATHINPKTQGSNQIRSLEFEGKKFTLFVKNIPTELIEDRLVEIFAK